MFPSPTRDGICVADAQSTDQVRTRRGLRDDVRRWMRALCITTASGIAATLVTVDGGLGFGLTPEWPASLVVASGPIEQGEAGMTCPRARITLIAHRGTGPGTRSIAGHRYSEDTIPAFVKALQSGADGFETDYWPIRDGRIVSHHDPSLDRMTNGTGALRWRPWSYVSQVRNVSGAAVPTAAAVQRETQRYGGMRQQEFKQVSQFSTRQLRALLRLDRRYVAHPSRQILITADRLSALRRIGSLDSSVGLGLITRKTGRPVLAALPRWLDVILIELRSADARYIQRAHTRGLEVSVRGVNTLRQLRRAVRVGADRAVTDRPEALGRAC